MYTTRPARRNRKMDKSFLISMFLSFATSNDVLKYEPVDQINTGIHGNPTGTTAEWPPKFCNSLACPKFNILSSAEDYEERMYEVSNWVSTSMEGVNYNAASSTMFMKLFGYISGQNVKEEKIEMTCPVTMRVIPSQGPACESNFTMSFFISPEIGQAPSPSNKKVFLASKSSVTVYVRQFSGFTRDFEKTWGKQAVELGNALDKAGLKYESEYYYTAGYDAPFKLFNRHNEIWFVKK